MDRDRGEHLPNLRSDRSAPHPSWLPRQRRGVTPQMIGRYPDFDVLETADTWDEATRRVVLARLRADRPLRFFDDDEKPTLYAFCDTCMAQDGEPRIPVAAAVDAKLADGMLDGFQYADMPDDRDTWRLVLRGLDEVTTTTHRTRFADCSTAQREGVVGQFAAGRLSGGVWDELDPARAWSVCMRAILSAFYSHPWAWNEIGFGGPAYPRGFMRLGPIGTREPYETPGATSEDPVEAVRQHPEVFDE